MTHPRLDTQDVSTLLVSVARNPDRRERWISTSSDDRNLGEEAIEDVRSAGRGKKGDKDDAVLSYAMIEKDADSHDH